MLSQGLSTNIILIKLNRLIIFNCALGDVKMRDRNIFLVLTHELVMC